jgi:hypothetical protein
MKHIGDNFCGILILKHSLKQGIILSNFKRLHLIYSCMNVMIPTNQESQRQTNNLTNSSCIYGYLGIIN